MTAPGLQGVTRGSTHRGLALIHRILERLGICSSQSPLEQLGYTVLLRCVLHQDGHNSHLILLGFELPQADSWWLFQQQIRALVIFHIFVVSEG